MSFNPTCFKSRENKCLEHAIRVISSCPCLGAKSFCACVFCVEMGLVPQQRPWEWLQQKGTAPVRGSRACAQWKNGWHCPCMALWAVTEQDITSHHVTGSSKRKEGGCCQTSNISVGFLWNLWEDSPTCVMLPPPWPQSPLCQAHLNGLSCIRPII